MPSESHSPRPELWPALRDALAETRLLGAQLLRRHRLSVGRYFTLRWIASSDGRRLSALAEEFGISRPAATAIVASLETHGWVRRERTVADRRGVVVRTTPKAAALMRELDRDLERIVRRSTESVPTARRRATVETIDLARSGMHAWRERGGSDRSGVPR